MLNIEELEELLDSIHDKIDSEITIANRSSKQDLNKVLEKYGFALPDNDSYAYIDLNASKILIVG